MESIGAEGILVDGQLAVVLELRDDVEYETPDDFELAGLVAQSVYIDMHVQADEQSEEMAGLDVQCTMALNEQTQWVYIKTLGLPQELLEEEPMSWMLVSMTGSGMLLQLDGLIDDWNRVGGLELEDDDESAVTVEIGGKPGVVSEPDLDFQPNLSLTDDGEAEQLFWDFLTGRATGEQIDEAYKLLAEAARDVSVREEQPGLHVLTARDFNLEDADPDEIELVGDMTLVIVYREGSGIESAALENLGEYGGTLRLTPIDQIDETLFDQQRVIEPGVTNVLNLSAFKPLIEQALADDD
jgi:hypothetical protein